MALSYHRWLDLAAVLFFLRFLFFVVLNRVNPFVRLQAIRVYRMKLYDVFFALPVSTEQAKELCMGVTPVDNTLQKVAQ